MQLMYFPIRGRAEAIRLILEDQGAQYEFKAVEREEWQRIKPSTPFGQIPMLTDGDFQLPQSNAIIRYLGRKYDMYGKGIRENAWVDAILDHAEDIRVEYLIMIYDKACSDEARHKHITEVFHIGLTKLEKLLVSNGGGDGWIVGSGCTIADITLFELLDQHLALEKNLLKDFPKLAGLHARVAARPRIAAYLASGKRAHRINGNGKGQ